TRHLEGLVEAVVGEVPEDVAAQLRLQPPKDRKFGDLALGCFPLAKLRKSAPPKIAAELAAAFAPDDVLESAVATGPFVNFRFRRSALAEYVVTGVRDGVAPFGPAKSTGEVIVIDYSSPNIAKPFHMGHLRSTVIGSALCKIHRHLGHEVHGINHLGDWGSQFGKIITAFRHWGSDAELEASPMRHLFEIYVRYGREAKEDPALDEESAENFRRLESGEDNDERRLWERLRDISLAAFEGPYERLGVEFDHFTGESFYEDKMEAAIGRVAEAGILETSEGAEVVAFGDDMPPCILRKSDGTTIYATRDLAAIFHRLETFHFDRALYVVGSEQKLHFQQLREVARKLGLPEAEHIEHVPFGLILAKNEESGKWEKFATRGGNAIFLDEVLDEAVANVRKIISEKNPHLEDADAVAEQVGVSAIVFNDLKNSRIKDVKFDWESMLNFEGETGPYVQFAVARLSGILRNADRLDDDGGEGFGSSDVDWALLEDAEQVLLTMLEFGPAVERASAQNEPSVITSLMIDLAGDIHSYLRDHHVLGAEDAVRDARLALVAAARSMLKTGLGLLGVAAPDRM
ncbi:MAG: arginine--tRNA ligase, partial [Actinomycetota bacterium]|nr:arginine--tRNA ligase [Actinomycetota bacterium]